MKIQGMKAEKILMILAVLVLGLMMNSCDTATTEDDEGGVPCGVADETINCGDVTAGQILLMGNDVYGYDSHYDTKGEDVIYKLTLTDTKSLAVIVVPGDTADEIHPYIFRTSNGKACSNKVMARPDPNVDPKVAALLAAPPGEYFIVVDTPHTATPSLKLFGVTLTCN